MRTWTVSPLPAGPGNMLDQLLSEAGMSREEIYLTNVVKCHPPGNRDPKPEEQEQCMPYLKYETWLVKPRIIVCLGRIAAQRIIRPDYRITREHGTFVYRKSTYLTAVTIPPPCCAIWENGRRHCGIFERSGKSGTNWR